MAITQRLTLDAFLALLAEEPALELESDGTVAQKVSPQGQHSLLQFALCERINRFARPRRLALALPELRGIHYYYYIGIDRAQGALTNVSVRDTLEHAHQRDTLQAMLAQRPVLEAAGVVFDSITNHELLWAITT